ncbi:Mediator of RNA polymerase II transcription subunit 19, partial [Fragariocoptes setiger]
TRMRSENSANLNLHFMKCTVEAGAAQLAGLPAAGLPAVLQNAFIKCVANSSNNTGWLSSPRTPRQDSSGTLKTTISLGRTPAIVHSGPFYLMKDLPESSELTGSTNLINHHRLGNTYAKLVGRKTKDGLSAFLPNLPGNIDVPATLDDSIYKLLEWRIITPKDILPLTATQLIGFRLHPGPLPPQYRISSQFVHIKHKKHKKKQRTTDTPTHEFGSSEGQDQQVSERKKKERKKEKKKDKKKDKKRKNLKTSLISLRGDLSNTECTDPAGPWVVCEWLRFHPPPDEHVNTSTTVNNTSDDDDDSDIYTNPILIDARETDPNEGDNDLELLTVPPKIRYLRRTSDKSLLCTKNEPIKHANGITSNMILTGHQNGVNASGSNDECIEALGRPISSFKVTELRDELQRRGIIKSGNKKELIDRLRTHLHNHGLVGNKSAIEENIANTVDELPLIQKEEPPVEQVPVAVEQEVAVHQDDIAETVHESTLSLEEDPSVEQVPVAEEPHAVEQESVANAVDESILSSKEDPPVEQAPLPTTMTLSPKDDPPIEQAPLQTTMTLPPEEVEPPVEVSVTDETRPDELATAQQESIATTVHESSLSPEQSPLVEQSHVAEEPRAVGQENITDTVNKSALSPKEDPPVEQAFVTEEPCDVEQATTQQETVEDAKASRILFIQNLVRPYTLKQLKELLTCHGPIDEDKFWTDKVKSKCFAVYESIEVADMTRKSLHGRQWPSLNTKTLKVEFSTEEALNNHMKSERDSPPPVSAPTIPATTPVCTTENPSFVPVSARLGEKVVAHPETREPTLNANDKPTTITSSLRERLGGRVSDVTEQKRLKEETNGKGDEPDGSVSLLEDLFRKTKAQPHIFWLPLNGEQAAERRRVREAERRRNQQQNQHQQHYRSPPPRRRYSWSRSPVNRRGPNRMLPATKPRMRSRSPIRQSPVTKPRIRQRTRSRSRSRSRSFSRSRSRQRTPPRLLPVSRPRSPRPRLRSRSPVRSSPVTRPRARPRSRSRSRSFSRSRSRQRSPARLLPVSRSRIRPRSRTRSRSRSRSHSISRSRSRSRQRSPARLLPVTKPRARSRTPIRLLPVTKPRMRPRSHKLEEDNLVSYKSLLQPSTSSAGCREYLHTGQMALSLWQFLLGETPDDFGYLLAPKMQLYRVLRESEHQVSNSSRDNPDCIMPGVAITTHGPTSSKYMSGRPLVRRPADGRLIDRSPLMGWGTDVYNDNTNNGPMSIAQANHRHQLLLQSPQQHEAQQQQRICTEETKEQQQKLISKRRKEIKQSIPRGRRRSGLVTCITTQHLSTCSSFTTHTHSSSSSPPPALLSVMFLTCVLLVMGTHSSIVSITGVEAGTRTSAADTATDLANQANQAINKNNDDDSKAEFYLFKIKLATVVRLSIFVSVNQLELREKTKHKEKEEVCFNKTQESAWSHQFELELEELARQLSS